MDTDLISKTHQLFHTIPKTEIHLHLEAMASVDTIYELIVKNNLHIDGIQNQDDLIRKFQVQNLNEFINLFVTVIQPSFCNIADFRMLLRDARAYLKRNSVYYAEMFLAPTRFLENHMQYPDMLAVIEDECHQALEADQCEMRFIVDVSRSYGIENASYNLDLVLKYSSPFVIGIGLGGAEINNPAANFQAVFERARNSGLHTVAHAGEDVGPESIRDAVELLHVERIGHGISAYLDPDLMDLLRERQIPLEVCPTSNVYTQRYVKTMSEHPVRRYFQYGLFVTLNTDDPVVFGVELADEYLNLYQHCAFSIEDLIQILKNGLYATFMKTDRKNAHWLRITDLIQKKRQELGI